MAHPTSSTRKKPQKGGISRILMPLLVVILLVIVVVQYLQSRKFHPPEDYTYGIREDIDLDYYDQTVVSEYYETAEEIGAFARQCWATDRIDVLHADGDDPKSSYATHHYTQLRARADHLGEKLARSSEMKDKGLHNADIRKIEEEGLSLVDYEFNKTFPKGLYGFGDEGPGVFQLQKHLIAKGYQMPHDGKYFAETELAVRTYQSKANLPSTGIADENTLRSLLK